MILGHSGTQVVFGARFRGTSLDMLRATIRPSLESAGLGLVISASFAGIGALWLSFPVGELWLAYAPGGIGAMAILALALGLDAAFVAAHQMIRFLALSLSAPLDQGARPRPRRSAAA